jgi:hypothetical protein
MTRWSSAVLALPGQTAAARRSLVAKAASTYARFAPQGQETAMAAQLWADDDARSPCPAEAVCLVRAARMRAGTGYRSISPRNRQLRFNSGRQTSGPDAEEPVAVFRLLTGR